MSEFTIEDIFGEFLRRNKNIYPNVTVEQMVNYDITNKCNSFAHYKTHKREIDNIEFSRVGPDELIEWLEDVKDRDCTEILLTEEGLSAIGKIENTMDEILLSYNMDMAYIAERCLTTDDALEIKKLEETIKESQKRLNVLMNERQRRIYQTNRNK